jgi:hypothetical protein
MGVWEVKMLFVCIDVFKHYTESSSFEDVKMLGHKWHAIRHPDQLVDKLYLVSPEFNNNLILSLYGKFYGVENLNLD